MRGPKYLPTFFCGVPYYSFSILYTKTLSVLGRAMVVCKAALAVGMIKKESSKVLPAYLPDSTLHLQKQGASRLLASLRLFALRGKARRCTWTRTSDAIVTGQNHADCSLPLRSIPQGVLLHWHPSNLGRTCHLPSALGWIQRLAAFHGLGRITTSSSCRRNQCDSA